MSADKSLDSSFVDIPEVFETFSDSLNMTFFDGQALRIEFCVTRITLPTQTNKSAVRKKYPCCRIALTPNAMVELYNRLSQHIKAMQKSGTLKQVEKPPSIIQ
jgi:hypothetical protein